MNELVDICRVRVRFSEIDSTGVLRHGVLIAYFEDGRESFGRRYPGIGYAVIQKSGIYAPVYEIELKSLAPLSLDDEAEIRTRYVYRPGARLDYEYEVRRASDGLLCATGRTTQLFIDPGGGLLLDPPGYYTRWQERFLGIEDATI